MTRILSIALALSVGAFFSTASLSAAEPQAGSVKATHAKHHHKHAKPGKHHHKHHAP